MAGELLRERFEDEGIDVRVEVRGRASRGRRRRVRVSLSSGDLVEAERLLVATGRRANVERSRSRAARRRAHEARGSPSTSGCAQGRASGRSAIRAASRCSRTSASTRRVLLRRTSQVVDYVADYRAIPASVFTDPQVASVGYDAGRRRRHQRHRIEGGRLSTYERPKRPGLLKLAADPAQRVVVGAVAVGPEAGEWIGQLTLAVRARSPDRRPPRHDPALPDVLGGDLRRPPGSREPIVVDGDQRRGRDLNPRGACTPNGFRDRPVRPLRHPSEPTA